MNKTIDNIVKDIVKDLVVSGTTLAVLAGNAYAVDLKRFENYRERAETVETMPITVNDTLYCLHKYDLRPADGIADVGEFYPAYSIYGILQHQTKHPYMYCFNLNNDKDMNANEMLIDEAIDGLNGKGEYWLKSDYIEDEYDYTMRKEI